MACHLSIFAAFLLVFTTTFVSAKMAKCTIERYGALTMFNGERATVKFPCKFRLADFNCGGYNVEVTPRSAVDGADQFSPVAVWVKITELSSGKYYSARTSDKLIQHYTDGNTKSVWENKGGNLQLDKEDYLKKEQYARLLIAGVKVKFATSETRWGVEVKCTYDSDADFVSQDYPTSFCGNESSTNVIASRKQDLFNNIQVGDETVILYDALNHTDVIQSSPDCEDAAGDFQNCQNSKTDSIRTCGPTFTDATLARCLINDDDKIGRFHKCVKLACKNIMANCATKLKKFKDYVEEKCDGRYANTPFATLSCP